MNLIRSLLLAFFAAAAVACTPGPSLPDSDADLTGTLTEILPTPGEPGARVLVEPPASPDLRAIVRVDGGTRIYVMERGVLRAASIDDLATGDVLQVWTTGVELRSYPRQVFATRVHVFR
ncbi:MAG TPA: hypothetical protein VHG93_18755 [Longimicrobium sp.]|nr:hypothetical protein [Longimicrobium sp.]